jgi:heat shock transcription factor
MAFVGDTRLPALKTYLSVDKVPHLQSGVLKNETPLELWEFINPFFKREQPQLLNRVTRKNNRPGVLTQPIPPGTGGTRSSARQAGMISPGGQYHPVHLITDGSTEGEALPLVGPSGQMFDISAITSGIAAIRQTQASIGADLKALQTSNEHLWREALESRERNQKHQETIDLIVSFLERLFGTEGEGLRGLKEALRRGGLARTREDEVAEEGGVSKKRRRLGLDRMIEDGRTGSGDDSDGQIVELANGDYRE